MVPSARAMDQITIGDIFINGKFCEYTAWGVVIGVSTIVISGSGQIPVDGRPVQIPTNGLATGASGSASGCGQEVAMKVQPIFRQKRCRGPKSTDGPSRCFPTST
jgi:hypothetical protein